MKKTTLLKTMLLLCALVVGSGSVWAQTTITWAISGVTTPNAKSQPCNTTLTTSSITGGSGTWTASTGSNNCYSSTDGGKAHFGSSATQFNGTITLSESSIPSSAIITDISLDGTTNGTYTVSATVGGSAFGSSTTFVNGEGCSFSGNVVGNAIVLTFSTTANSNVMISEITVTYTTESISVTGVSLPSTADVAVGKTITLTPTFAPTTATNKNVSWESDDEDIATVDDDGVVTGVALGTANITVTTEDGGFTAICAVTVDDGSIDLLKTGTISFTTFNGDVLGSGSYQSDKDCDLTASNGKVYTWNEKYGYYNNSGWQIKKPTDGGIATSPAIKSVNGFTISVTHSTGNDVTISDGTSSGTNSLTTTKTNTTITIVGKGGYTVISGITITPTILNPSDPVDDGEGNLTITTSDNMAGWRAFYDDSQAYTADANTTVYIAASDPVGTKITLSNIGSKVIPADVPVILKTSADNHKITLTKGGSADKPATNKLDVTDGTDITNKYRLGYNSTNGVGFYPYSETSPEAGIVYLDISSASAHALTIDFEEGDVTGITEVSAKKEFKGEYFNLAGQHVDANHKGIVVVNGKKFFNK